MQTSYAVRSWSKLQCRLNHSKQCWKIIIQWVTLASFCSLKKRCLQWQRRKKPAEWPTLRTFISREERCRYKKNQRTWLTFSQWLMTSVGKSQEADNTQTSHLSVMKLTLVRPIVVIRCCYYSVCRHTSHLKRVLHLSARYTVVTSNTGHL